MRLPERAEVFTAAMHPSSAPLTRPVPPRLDLPFPRRAHCPITETTGEPQLLCTNHAAALLPRPCISRQC